MSQGFNEQRTDHIVGQGTEKVEKFLLLLSSLLLAVVPTTNTSGMRYELHSNLLPHRRRQRESC